MQKRAKRIHCRTRKVGIHIYCCHSTCLIFVFVFSYPTRERTTKFDFVHRNIRYFQTKTYRNTWEKSSANQRNYWRGKEGIKCIPKWINEIISSYCVVIQLNVCPLRDLILLVTKKNYQIIFKIFMHVWRRYLSMLYC